MGGMGRNFASNLAGRRGGLRSGRRGGIGHIRYSQGCKGAISAIGISLYIVASGLAGANRIHKLALDAGNVGVEDPFGFGAERDQGVFPELRIVEAGFMGVDAPELVPVEDQVIGYKPFRMGQEQAVEGAFGWGEVEPCPLSG